MGERTAIEWTHHTWSPWHGCTKVSAGCAHCYAEIQSHRYGHDIWGAHAERRFFGEHHWNEPRRWHRAALEAGEPRRIFPSMCDPFEDRPDLENWRQRMFDLTEQTPYLDWLLVTKRPQNIPRMWHWKGVNKYRRNIWLLASAEDQPTAHQRIPELLKCRELVPILGLSAEPLLGPLDVSPWLEFLDWIIAGGESQHGARPMHPNWPRHLQMQCQATGTPFFFKQWGEWLPACAYYQTPDDVKDRALDQPHKIWSPCIGFQNPDFDGQPALDSWILHRPGKHAAGCLLDGREWKQFPNKDGLSASPVAPAFQPVKERGA